MRAKVISTFKDQYTKQLYHPGDSVDFDSDRVKNLVKKGLVEAEKGYNQSERSYKDEPKRTKSDNPGL